MAHFCRARLLKAAMKWTALWPDRGNLRHVRHQGYHTFLPIAQAHELAGVVSLLALRWWALGTGLGRWVAMLGTGLGR